MRELTVRIRFSVPSLGSVKERGGGRFFMPRSQGAVIFLPTWHEANMRMAAEVFGKHQDETAKIRWDMFVDGTLRADCWHRRYYPVGKGRQRYSLHEAFQAGQVVGLNCCVPPRIVDEDFWSLMSIAGRYKGLSPYRPAEFGFYIVESIRPRRLPEEVVEQETVEKGLVGEVLPEAGKTSGS